MLQSFVGRKPVIGIFDSSITTALHLTLPNSKFGILTTGDNWTDPLVEGVKSFLGTREATSISSIFGGVAATGVTIDDIGIESHIAAKAKVTKATRQLVRGGDISVVCVGGAILNGMENWIREACVAELGLESGERVQVVDQMLAGIMTLYSLYYIRA
jgi:Asp/Glu/hydantoin racemase